MSDQVEYVYQHIGRALRRARKEAKPKISQDEVASQMGHMSRASICNIEKGRQRVMLHDLPTLARAVRLRAVDLLPDNWKA
jgi:DNA-binding XRE family transcriptional regulator